MVADGYSEGGQLLSSFGLTAFIRGIFSVAVHVVCLISPTISIPLSR